MEKNPLKREHIDTQFLALSISILAFLIFAYKVGSFVWITDFQSFISLISGIFALFIGVVALLRYYSKRTSLNFLFIGIGFIGVGLLDLFQIIIDLGGMQNLFTASLSNIYPVTSVISKTFLAVLMFLSWFLSKKENPSGNKNQKQELKLMILVVVSFMLFLGVFVYLMVTGIFVESLWVIILGLISLMLLVLTLLGYLFNKGWLYDDFNYWIIFLLSFLILSQIFYLPFFNLEYFNMMNLSVCARFFAYLGILTGFLNSIYVMYKKEVEIQEELKKKNKELDETKSKVEEAYLVLRQEKWDIAKTKGTADKILKGILDGEK